MPIRGFKDSGIIACFTEPNQTGDVFDIDAPRNAPVKDPINHLDKVSFHTSFFQYEVAHGPTDVTINHPAVSTSSHTYGVVYNQGGIFNPVPGGIQFTVYGNVLQQDHLLVTHSLGYVPKFMVSLDGRRLPDGWITQNTGDGTRAVSAYATSTGIYLRETAVTGANALAATSRLYRVIVFNTAEPDPAKPVFFGEDGVVELGRGLIRTDRDYLLRASEVSPFALNLGPTLDVSNGKVRSATGGIVTTEPGYNGSMPAPVYVSVGV